MLIEAKATRTVRPKAAESLSRLKKAISGYTVDWILVHLEGGVGTTLTGVRAATCREKSKMLSGHDSDG
jgi:hypothetical protein